MSDNVRLLIAAGVVWYAFGMPGMPDGATPSGPYTGPLTALHSAGAGMASGDRATLSAAMSAAGDALAADSRDIVDTTAEAQDFFLAVVEFSYTGMGKPSAKYPAVAKALSDAVKGVVGDEAKALDAADKAKLVEVLREAGRALQ